MGRPASKTTEPANMPALLPQAEQSVAQAQDAASKLDAEADGILAAGIDLGRLEALDFIATVANSAILPIYEKVKKSKAWVNLRNPQSSNGSNFESLEQFCKVKLGKTYGRLQHLVANRNLIGQEAFEQAERLGLHQRDYNAIKALPAPDQELVRRAVEEAQSRDEVIDLMQELAVRHAQVNEAAAEEKKQLQQDHEYASEQLEKERTRADKAEKKLRAGGLKARPLNEQVTPFQEEISARQGLIEKGIAAHIEAVLGVEAWWTKMVTEAPDYDPTRQVLMPREVALVALQLEDTATRMAQLVGAMQHELQTRFGDDLAEARQYLMQEPEGANA